MKWLEGISGLLAAVKPAKKWLVKNWWAGWVACLFVWMFLYRGYQNEQKVSANLRAELAARKVRIVYAKGGEYERQGPPPWKAEECAAEGPPPGEPVRDKVDAKGGEVILVEFDDFRGDIQGAVQALQKNGREHKWFVGAALLYPLAYQADVTYCLTPAVGVGLVGQYPAKAGVRIQVGF